MSRDVSKLVDDIGVYCKPEELEKKKIHAKRKGTKVWWSLSRSPRKPPARIFFATEGYWRGYFSIEEIVRSKRETRVYLMDWYYLEDCECHPRSQFQGFTYDVPEISPILDCVPAAEKKWEEVIS